MITDEELAAMTFTVPKMVVRQYRSHTTTEPPECLTSFKRAFELAGWTVERFGRNPDGTAWADMYRDMKEEYSL